MSSIADPFLLMIVERAVSVPGIEQIGLYLLPGLPKKPFPHAVCLGDSVELRRPDGSRMSTTILSIEHTVPPKGAHPEPLMIPGTFQESDVPVGTEVWWIAERSK
jgi:hypothetical protein